jgi:hypothetical protein
VTDKKRPGTMSDEDRALASRRVATPGRGVELQPIHESNEDDFTPVGDVLAMTDDPELRDVITAIWRHTANVELRCRILSKSTDTAELRDAIVDISGKSGSNGKLGALKERVDKAEARRWWAVTFLAGIAITVIGSAIAFGVWKGSIETDVKTLKRAVYRSHEFSSPPDEPAAKERQ